MKHFGNILLAHGLGFVIWCRMDRGVADFYATRLYPAVSAVLSRFSSLLPFTLEEFIVVGFIAAIIIAVVKGIHNRRKWYSILGNELRIIVLIYVWFYLGWGINYYRSPLPLRLETPLAQYDETRFKAFLDDYVCLLNETALDHGTMIQGLADNSDKALEDEVRAFYDSRDKAAGLAKPHGWQSPKTAIASGLFSKVGVTGSMGPFLGESMLNGDMPDSEYAFTFAHEFAHLMGVSSEAEANFWAFRFCDSSDDPSVRYSGYSTLLGNMLRNARRLLSDEDYDAFIDSIAPEVKAEYNERAEYWAGKYSKILGEIQSKMYNAYLKGNGISSGTKNYDEVLGLLMTDELSAL